MCQSCLAAVIGLNVMAEDQECYGVSVARSTSSTRQQTGQVVG